MTASNTPDELSDSQGRIIGWYGTPIDADIYKKTVEVLHDRGREFASPDIEVLDERWRSSRFSLSGRSSR